MQTEELTMGLTEAAAEKRRLMRLLKAAGVTDEVRKTLIPVIDNVAWMKSKLDDAREMIADDNITVKGEKGIRNSPYFQAYESLWKAYIIGMTQITQYLPKKTAAKADKAVKPKTVLEVIRSKHTA